MTVPEYKENDEVYKKVAQMLWIKYLQSEIKTKKILHSVFNEQSLYHTS
jgi:hypothetical protein